MNKKMLLTTGLVAVALATSSLYSVSYASSDDDTSVKLGEQRKEMMKEKKEMHGEMMDERKDMHDDFFDQLDQSVQDEIKALHESYKPQFEAIKNDTTKTNDEKEVAMKALHEELHAKVRALIPADLLAEFDAIKDDLTDMKDEWKMKKDQMKTEWKNTKADRKAKKQERRATMKTRYRIVFSKVDNVLAKFEGSKTTEQLITTYTNIIAKLDEKLSGLDATSDVAVFLENLKADLADRIGELKASA